MVAVNGGALTLCLKCADLDASARFYEALGLEVLDHAGEGVLLKSGHARILLLTFLKENSLNFRGGDPFTLHAAASAAGLELAGEPERYAAAKYSATADGACWSTYDPDGNNVFFDTNEAETSEAGRAAQRRQVLEDSAQLLEALGASGECTATLRALAAAEG
ncbi:MAG: VOC family protein [Pseudomonadota bacterium]